jgi:hypothetical protein
MMRVHITGCIRSGTTLLVEMMRFGFQSDGPWDHETSLLSSVSHDLDMCITKHPGELDLLARLIPHDDSLHGICVMRDPRSVITSVHKKAQDCYATSLAHWKKSEEHASRLRSTQRFITVRYETLVSQPDEVQEQIVHAFPFLEVKEKFSSFQNASCVSEDAKLALNGLRAAAADRINGWRKHLPRVKEQLDQHPDLPHMLIRNGYESDTQWLRILDGVSSRHHKSWQDNGVHFLKRIDRWQRRERKIRNYLSEVRRRRTHGCPMTKCAGSWKFPASSQAALESKK